MGQSNLNFFGEEMETGRNVGEKPMVDPIETNGNKTDGFVELAVFQVDYTLKKIGEVSDTFIFPQSREEHKQHNHESLHIGIGNPF